MGRGYEHILDAKLVENAPLWAEQAVQKLSPELEKAVSAIVYWDLPDRPEIEQIARRLVPQAPPAHEYGGSIPCCIAASRMCGATSGLSSFAPSSDATSRSASMSSASVR